MMVIDGRSPDEPELTHSASVCRSIGARRSAGSSLRQLSVFHLDRRQQLVERGADLGHGLVGADHLEK